MLLVDAIGMADGQVMISAYGQVMGTAVNRRWIRAVNDYTYTEQINADDYASFDRNKME